MFKKAVLTIVERQGYITEEQVRELLSMCSRTGRDPRDPTWSTQLYQRVRHVATAAGKVVRKEGDRFYFLSPGEKPLAVDIDEIVSKILNMG